MFTTRPFRLRGRVLAIAAALLAAACSGGDGGDVVDATPATSSTDGDSAGTATSTDEEATITVADVDCEAVAGQFVTRGSANADLVDPEVSATCDGEAIQVVSNGVPDFTYIGTSPGAPDGREFTFALAATPTVADETTAVPYVGPIGVTLSGIAIYGPTEGTGGDVDSLPGIVSACGSHNGPGGFHTHKILTSDETDCWFTPDEVAAEPQLAGYAFDGFPIYTGNDQYTSSWQLVDEALFATDTWAAHEYVAGSGDLDECNGRVDENGD